VNKLWQEISEVTKDIDNIIYYPIQHRNLQQHCCDIAADLATFHIAVQRCRDIAKNFFLQYYFSSVAAIF